MPGEDAVEDGDAVARLAVVIVHRCHRVLKIKWLLAGLLQWVLHHKHEEQGRVLHLLWGLRQNLQRLDQVWQVDLSLNFHWVDEL